MDSPEEIENIKQTLEALEIRKTAEIAKYFRWNGDGKLTKERRWKAYRHWLTVFREERFQDLEELVTKFQKAAENLEFAARQQNTEICATMKIVGMTTTAAAKNAELIQNLGCKILIAEEAAEVSEFHIWS